MKYLVVNDEIQDQLNLLEWWSLLLTFAGGGGGGGIDPSIGGGGGGVVPSMGGGGGRGMSSIKGGGGGGVCLVFKVERPLSTKSVTEESPWKAGSALIARRDARRRVIGALRKCMVLL